ncbi:MAG: CotH kinase family protein, partial [Fibrobacterota bacterium]|nr:CotH kinase family protein [Chitinispirillaceae bacterium]
MQPIKRIILLTVFAGSLLSQSFAQDVNLSGKVVDENGVAVSGAQLTLKKLKYTCTTNDNGEYRLDKSQSPVINSTSGVATRFVGMTPTFLELGNYYDATITVFSIRGAVVSKLTVTNQNRVAINKLIPSNLNSQSVIISISTLDRVINIKAIRCGSQWVYNNKTIIKTSGNSMQKHADATADVIDTLVVKKDGMKKKQLELTSLVASLDDIVLYYDDVKIDSSLMINDVTFSEQSRTFKTPLSITMTTSIPNAEIRYTTTGELPTSSSKLYSEAITISSTAQLRAAAFVDGKMSGLPSTAIYIARDFDYTSDIPILIMEGYGGGAPPDKYNFIDLGVMTFDPVDGKSSLDDLPTLSTRAGYHLRGQSSMMMFNQAPYRIELWDNFNKDVNHPVMGMPSDADWALISPCTDNTLIRNVLATEIGKQIGLKTVQYRFCEVFINQDGGPLTESDYEGVYTLFQPVKIKKNTLNLKKLDENDTDPAKITGGYLFKFDNAVK